MSKNINARTSKSVKKTGFQFIRKISLTYILLQCSANLIDSEILPQF